MHPDTEHAWPIVDSANPCRALALGWARLTRTSGGLICPIAIVSRCSHCAESGHQAAQSAPCGPRASETIQYVPVTLWLSYTTVMYRKLTLNQAGGTVVAHNHRTMHQTCCGDAKPYSWARGKLGNQASRLASVLVLRPWNKRTRRHLIHFVESRQWGGSWTTQARLCVIWPRVEPDPHEASKEQITCPSFWCWKVWWLPMMQQQQHPP